MEEIFKFKLLMLNEKTRKKLLKLELDDTKLTEPVKKCVSNEKLLQSRNYTRFINLLLMIDDEKLQNDSADIIIKNKENYLSEIELIRLLEYMLVIDDEQLKNILVETLKSPVFAKRKIKRELVFVITTAPTKVAATLISAMACDDKYKNHNQLFKDMGEIWDCVDTVDAVATYGKQQEKLLKTKEKKLLYKSIF